MKKRIIVTGGTGYIGSHTAVELIQEGYEVILIDNLYNSEAEVAGRIGMITGTTPELEVFDLCDRDKLDSCLKKNKDIAAIIHFAAYKAVGESVNKPLEYYRNNLVSLINLLDAMRTYSIPGLVFSSSCTVYGQPEKLPVTEQSPLLKAESPYGNTKKIMEDIIADAVGSHDLNAISLRYFNPIGAHESALIGEAPSDVPDNLVPYLTQTAIGLRPFLRVFGNDYDTPDGTAVRDYLHVVDLAKAHVVALNRMLEKRQKAGFEVFNLGTGKGCSVMEVIRSFEKVSGLKLNYQVAARRPGDVVKIWADPTFANQELGWKAEKDLDEMMRSAWAWEKARNSSKTSN